MKFLKVLHVQSCIAAGILEDSYALCAACKQPLLELLSLMEVFKNESDYTVLSCLIDVCSNFVYQLFILFKYSRAIKMQKNCLCITFESSRKFTLSFHILQ